MRSRPSCVGAALLAAAVLLAVTPVRAKTTESQEDSYSAFADFASQLQAQSAATAKAAAYAIEQSEAAIAEGENNLAPRLENFRLMLNEQKARLGIIGRDAAARMNVWKEAAAKAWNETWSDTWAHSWTEIHRSAMETLDRFRDWLAKQSVSDERTETPV